MENSCRWRAAASEVIPRSACRSLWGRVLLVGVRDAIAEHLGYEHHHPSALFWLLYEHSSGVGSPLWICESLNLNMLDEIRLFASTATAEDFELFRDKAF